MGWVERSCEHGQQSYRGSMEVAWQYEVPRVSPK